MRENSREIIVGIPLLKKTRTQSRGRLGNTFEIEKGTVVN